ncbi:MAG: hypothetical protein LC797_07935, partial [Chloroflexi bacterium]|nr:hypothetical protein [Chloroflexota bacterium]
MRRRDPARPALQASRRAKSEEVFVLISFEGPDRYAQVGGLATRVSGLAEARRSNPLRAALY